MRLIYDTECNDLLQNFNTGEYTELDRMWCIVIKDMDTGQIYKNANRLGWTDPTNQPLASLKILEQADLLVAHNHISYDLTVFNTLFGWKPNPKTQIVDTYVLSRLLNPERESHSIEYYGKLEGRKKPEHEDWSQYTPEMLHRCEEDVEINHLAYLRLLREMK